MITKYSFYSLFKVMKSHTNNMFRKQHTGSRIACNRRSASVCLHTAFTRESAAHVGFVYMQFLPERGGATHQAFQCCFGNRAPGAANGRTGISVCVWGCV